MDGSLGKDSCVHIIRQLLYDYRVGHVTVMNTLHSQYNTISTESGFYISEDTPSRMHEMSAYLKKDQVSQLWF